MPVNKLEPDALYRRCDADQFEFETTAELQDLAEIIGQPRVVEAVNFGIGIQQKGYNLFALGPAGTGKTFLAVAFAVAALKEKRMRKIILARPAVEAGERLGFLPGDMQAKINPYLRPLLDALHEMMDYELVKSHMERDVIEVAEIPSLVSEAVFGDAKPAVEFDADNIPGGVGNAARHNHLHHVPGQAILFGKAHLDPPGGRRRGARGRRRAPVAGHPAAGDLPLRGLFPPAGADRGPAADGGRRLWRGHPRAAAAAPRSGALPARQRGGGGSLAPPAHQQPAPAQALRVPAHRKARPERRQQLVLAVAVDVGGQIGRASCRERV